MNNLIYSSGIKQLIPKLLLEHTRKAMSDYKNDALTIGEFQEKVLKLLDDFEPKLSSYQETEVQATKELVDEYFKEKDMKIREHLLLNYPVEIKHAIFYEIEKPLNQKVKIYCTNGINKFIIGEKLKKGLVKISKEDLTEMQSNFQREAIEIRRLLYDYFTKRKYYIDTEINELKRELQEPQYPNKIQKLNKN